MDEFVYKVCFVKNITSQLLLADQNKQRHFSLLLSSKREHDNFEQLNSVLSSAEILQQSISKGKSISNDLGILSEIILSGAKTMQIKAEANNYLSLINNAKLKIKFENKGMPVLPFLRDFLKPFLMESQDKKLEVYLRQVGQIPQNLFIDWRLYNVVLYQLVTNAIKSSKPGQIILIDIAYIKLEKTDNFQLIRKRV